MKPFVFEKVSVADASRAQGGQIAPSKTAAWNCRRGASEVDELTEITVKWLAGLPVGVRPMMLARQFPRIANNLAGIWRRVARCEAYLQSLVVDKRNGRRGFPPEVAQELSKLIGYYDELHPGRETPWDFVERGR